MYFLTHFVFSLAHRLMSMSRDNEHDDCAQQSGQGDRYYFGIYQVEIEHKCHARWHEEKAEISYEEIRKATHPFQFDDLQFQQERKYEHADDTRRQFHACKPYYQFAQS